MTDDADELLAAPFRGEWRIIEMDGWRSLVHEA
jgi:hypothetical protein